MSSDFEAITSTKHELMLCLGKRCINKSNLLPQVTTSWHFSSGDGSVDNWNMCQAIGICFRNFDQGFR